MAPPPFQGPVHLSSYSFHHVEGPCGMHMAPQTPPSSFHPPPPPLLSMAMVEAPQAAEDLALQLEAAKRIVLHHEESPPAGPTNVPPLGAPGPGRCAFGTHRKKQGLDRKDLPEDGFSWHKYGHKTLMGLFSRAYYRCTHRGSGCRAKKTVDTALKGSNEVRITYDGAHTHGPDREVGGAVIGGTTRRGNTCEGAHMHGLDREVAVDGTLVGGGSRSRESSAEEKVVQGMGKGEKAGGGGLGGDKDFEQLALLGVRKREEGPISPLEGVNIEIRCRKQRRVVMVNDSSSDPSSSAEVFRKFVVVEDGEEEGSQHHWGVPEIGPVNGDAKGAMKGAAKGAKNGAGSSTWEDTPTGQTSTGSPRSDDSAVIEQTTPLQHAQSRRFFDDQFESASNFHSPVDLGTKFGTVPTKDFSHEVSRSFDRLAGVGLDLELRL